MQPWGQPSPSPLEAQPKSTLQDHLFAKFRTSGRTGHIVRHGVALVVGIVVGIVALLLFALSIATQGRVFVTSSPPTGGDFIVQVGPTFMAHLLEEDLHSSGLPGNVKNVRVTFANSDAIQSAQMTISGDEQIGVVGIVITKVITIVVQPYIHACYLQVHVLHADLGGIAMTGIVAAFEGRVNQRLQNEQGGLPSGFTYCVSSVRTKPEGMFVAYSATPR